MKKEIRLAPKNSVILIMDQSIGEIPKAMNKALVAATPSCIAVGTLCEYDGETLISLSDGVLPPGANMFLVFDGVLRTPTRKLSLCSVLDEALIALDVPTERTRVQIWANDNTEPDQIHVVVAH
jgi:hypothetical protein